MSIFPLDSVRNAPIDHSLEPVLEDIREGLARFPYQLDTVPGDVEDVLDAFDQARPRLNVLASLLKEQPGGTGADVSTGLGFLPLVLARLGVHVIATEQDLRLCAPVRAQGLEVRPYCIGREPPPFPPASLDFLVLAEVLEHLKLAPIAVLRDLASVLRPGGTFVLTTPNVARLAHLEALAAGENFLEPFPEDLPSGTDPTDHVEHVREYSVREVVDAAEGAGLAVDRVLMTGWGGAGYNPLPNPYANDICILVAHF